MAREPLEAGESGVCARASVRECVRIRVLLHDGVEPLTSTALRGAICNFWLTLGLQRRTHTRSSRDRANRHFACYVKRQSDLQPNSPTGKQNWY